MELINDITKEGLITVCVVKHVRLTIGGNRTQEKLSMQLTNGFNFMQRLTKQDRRIWQSVLHPDPDFVTVNRVSLVRFQSIVDLAQKELDEYGYDYWLDYTTRL